MQLVRILQDGQDWLTLEQLVTILQDGENRVPEWGHLAWMLARSDVFVMFLVVTAVGVCLYFTNKASSYSAHTKLIASLLQLASFLRD